MDKVIVITLNYNQNEYSEKCIKSLLKSNFNNFSIFLIDNGSTKKSYSNLLKVLPKNDQRLIIKRLESNVGYVGGINIGLKVAEAVGFNYALIVNNDTIIDEFAIPNLVQTCQLYNDNAIVTGKVYHYDRPNVLQNIGQYCRNHLKLDYPLVNGEEEDIGQYDSIEERAMIDDVMWIIPFNVYKKVGSYSDYFYLYGEQNDYGFRAKKLDVKLIYTPKAKIWHKGSITTGNGDKKSPKLIYWGSMGTLKLAKIHFSKKDSKYFIRYWIVRNTLKRFYMFLFKKQTTAHLRAHFLAIWDFFHWKRIKYKDNGYNPF